LFGKFIYEDETKISNAEIVRFPSAIFGSDECDIDGYYAEDFIPILRPLTDLYKTIIHNGEEIIPIMKLAEMAMLNLSVFDTNNDISKNRIGELYDNRKVELFILGNRYVFVYNTGRFLIKCVNTNHMFPDYFDICNLYELFDFLNELKIDYRRLIDKGLAIDANSLETNPYK
jgi:hypothetical protein